MPVTTLSKGRSEVVRLLGLRVRIPPGYGYLSLVNVVCSQVEVSATGRSLVEGSPAECGVSECHLETSRRGRRRATGVVGPVGGGGGGWKNVIKKSLMKKGIRC
jgi:hypothetical protein